MHAVDSCKAMINFMQKETGKLLKLVAIPTTLSAAEYTILAGWTENGKKTGAKGSDFTSSAILFVHPPILCLLQRVYG